MATRVFSQAELDQLRRFPETITDEELVRYFTLTSGDVAFIERHRGSANRLGIAVQLCVLPWLGFVPDEVSAAPESAVARLTNKLDLPTGVLEDYGGRDQTRSDHLREVAAFLSWRPAGEVEFKELDQFLLARAMEHDAPTVLFRLACEHLRSCRVIRPGPEWLTRRVAAARTAASAETFQRVEPLLTAERCRQLDELLTVDAELGCTRLYWLATGATQASPKAINTELAKLAFLRELGADQLDLSRLPVERRRFLATIGRRSTAQALARRDP